jgi:hypothetical protein
MFIKQRILNMHLKCCVATCLCYVYQKRVKDEKLLKYKVGVFYLFQLTLILSENLLYNKPLKILVKKEEHKK